MPTEMELTQKQTQQGDSYEVSHDPLNSYDKPLPATSSKKDFLQTHGDTLISIDCSHSQDFNMTAGNPCQEDSSKLHLFNHRLFKDGGGEFQRSFHHSDTERLSRSDEVLKLKKFKKDVTLKLFKSTNQERIACGPSESHKFTRWQSLQDGEEIVLG
ncbi:hypothetical protein Tco_0650433 [Tanacetum coccineum]